MRAVRDAAPQQLEGEVDAVGTAVSVSVKTLLDDRHPDDDTG